MRILAILFSVLISIYGAGILFYIYNHLIMPITAFSIPFSAILGAFMMIRIILLRITIQDIKIMCDNEESDDKESNMKYSFVSTGTHAFFYTLCFLICFIYLLF